MNEVLGQQHYEKLKRQERGWVRRYVETMTGLSRAQVTRFITVYLKGEAVCYSRIGGIAFPGGTPGKTWSCWRRWMRSIRA